MKVLVVDDDHDIATLVALQLEHHGFHVAVAHNGVEALEQIRQDMPQLVVMDVEMPQMTGLECLKKLRQQASTAYLPVILLTGRDQPPDLFQGWQTGADLYITKPFENEDLLRRVQQICATHVEL